MNTADVDSWMNRNHFLLRRLHSLMGVIPIGAFLLEHLLTNSLAWLGPDKFNEQVHWLHKMHYLVVIEVVFIFLPLAFHAIYGVAIALQGRANAQQYPYMDNWRYTLQRVTAWITLIFIAVHLLHFRFASLVGGEEYVGTADPFALTQRGFSILLPTWLWITFYAVGLTSAVYHLCNGLVTFCITWGIAISENSRKRLSVGAAGLGVVLLAWGALSLYALQTVAHAESHGEPSEPAHVVNWLHAG